MRQVLKFGLVVLVLLIALASWLVFGTATSFSEDKRYLYIHDNQLSKDSVLAILKRDEIIGSTFTFSFIADRLEMWRRLKPGKFEILNGASALDIVRKLRNNQQSPVNLVINKLRTKEDLARLIGKQFATDSLAAISFLNNPDSLRSLAVDTNTVMTLVIPNTYTFYWNTSLRKIFRKLADEQEKFWQKNSRLEKASRSGFSPAEIYTLASIVEEETNRHDEKG